MYKIIRWIKNRISPVPGPYRVMWNSHIASGICLMCRFFKTPEQARKFCRNLEKDPDFISYVY